jgi:hypothetical protein
MNNASPPTAPVPSELPAPLPFEPGTSELPAAVTPDESASEPFLLLIDASGDPAWAGDAAVALAAGWARAGRRVVLADLHLEEPVLHDRVGEPNLDGVVDIFLYGASVARSARPPRGHEFFLIPAGTYTAAPDDVFGHPRWSKLIAGFREAGATMMVFMPPTAEGIRMLARWGREAVLLGASERGAALEALDALDVKAVLVPPGGAAQLEVPAASPVALAPLDLLEPAEPEAEALEPAPTDAVAAVEPAVEPADEHHGVEADPTDDFGEPAPGDAFAAPDARDDFDTRPDDEVEPVVLAAAPAVEPGVETAPEPGAASDVERGGGMGPVIPPSRRRQRRGHPMLWLLIGVALIAAAVLIVALLRPELFGGVGAFQRSGQPGDADARAEAIPPPPPTPTPLGDTLPYAVQVRAFVSLPPALNQVREQSRRAPDTPFYVVPEMTQGVLYFKVLAGMLPDTSAATELRRRLVQAGVVAAQDARDDAPGAWSLIQARPLAFHLGEYPEREEADSLVQWLGQRNIPAYPILLPYSDGTARVRVYAGAFPDSTHAEELRQMLRAAEVPAHLVHRIGQASAAVP